MMYRILIRYETGSTFGSSEEEDIITYCNDENDWKSKFLEFGTREEAREALQAIKEHYDFFQTYDGPYKLWERYFNSRIVNYPEPAIPEKNWFASERKNEKQNWYLAETTIILGGKSINCFWVGHFETLRSAEIVIDQNLDKIEF